VPVGRPWQAGMGWSACMQWPGRNAAPGPSHPRPDLMPLRTRKLTCALPLPSSPVQYIPQLASAIVRGNKEDSQEQPINLKGFLVGEL